MKDRYEQIDISVDSQKTKSNKKKSKKKKLIALATSFVALSLIASILVGVMANYYLNKLNYGDVKGSVSGTLDAEEEIFFDISGFESMGGDGLFVSTDFEYSGDEDWLNDLPTNSNKKTKSKIRDIIASAGNVIDENVSQQIQQQANAEIKENINSDGVWYSDNVYNLLIIGYDAGAAEQVMFEGATLPRSDAILIASINKTKKTVKLVSLSRATYVAIPGHGNKRINTAHAYGGAKTLVETIELNYKIRIDRYISVDFKGFEEIVNALGGVTVEMSKVEASFAFDQNKSAGKYKMNGHEALRYVRLRKTDSDRQRTGRQRKVLTAIAGQAKTMNLSKKLSFMDTVLPFVTTNFTKPELIDKAMELETYLSWPITQDIIPHEAVKLTMRDGKEVIILDWEETTDYVHSILYSGVTVKKK